MTEKAFQVDTGAGSISGSETGAGPPLLMLHGGPGLSDYMALLAGETTAFRAIHYQQRGLAPSALDGPFTVGRHVADAIAVLDGLGLPQALVLGHSWGGHLALQLAVAAPGRVSGLVVVDGLGVTGPDGGAGDLGQGLMGRLPEAALGQLGELAGRIGDRPPTDAEADEQAALLWPSYFADPARALPVPADMRVSVAGNMQAMASVIESLAGGFPAALASVTAPAVFVLGEQSPMPVSQGQQTAALLPDAEVVVVPGAGHLPWHEQPGCVAGALAAVRSRAGQG
jgi:pimeloyl-ACP methyl ester carboxylesterase